MQFLASHLSLPLEAVGPDPYPAKFNLPYLFDHVISRDKEGRPVSRVGDFIWDWTAYEPRGKSVKIYFFYWTNGRKKFLPTELTVERVARIRELQQILLVLIYNQDGRYLKGPVAIKQWLQGLMHVARFAEARQLTVQKVLSERDSLDSFIATVKSSVAHRIIAWLGLLHQKTSHEMLWFVPAKPQRWRYLRKQSQLTKASIKQTPPLPSRVYASVISGLAEEIDSIEAHIEQLVGMLRASILKYRTSLKDNDEALGPDLISRFGLEDYFFRRGFRLSLQGISSAILEIFRICKLQIHVFSGMRDAEAKHLPFHCMSSVPQRNGRAHALIAGLTTKLEGGRKRQAIWVTTEDEGFRAIRIAQKFATVLYGCIGITPSYSEISRDEYPLFISTGYLPWANQRLSGISSGVHPCNSILVSLSELRRRICPAIVEKDIVELEAIDPFRDWRGESRYAIGALWPLRPHQLRRSLALYANASGLVRLSSLRRQLQHITREMSLYYARGSAFAINFIAEDPIGFRQHVAFDFQNAEVEAQYLAFVNDVMRSDEPLHGPAGKFYDMKKGRDEVITQEEFSRGFKMGRIAYRASPLGGCTNPGVCETSKGMRLIDATCATKSCKYLIGKHSKIVNAIRLQRAALSHIDVASLTYQFELEDLNSLIATEVVWRPTAVVYNPHKEADDV